MALPTPNGARGWLATLLPLAERAGPVLSVFLLALAPLTDALATILALRPVQFTWRATGEAGIGFVADEVQAVVPTAVTGAPEAVDGAGQIVPQGLDASKLVPFLVGAVQALLQRVEALEARGASKAGRHTGRRGRGACPPPGRRPGTAAHRRSSRPRGTRGAATAA